MTTRISPPIESVQVTEVQSTLTDDQLKQTAVAQEELDKKSESPYNEYKFEYEDKDGKPTEINLRFKKNQPFTVRISSKIESVNLSPFYREYMGSTTLMLASVLSALQVIDTKEEFTARGNLFLSINVNQILDMPIQVYNEFFVFGDSIPEVAQTLRFMNAQSQQT